MYVGGADNGKRIPNYFPYSMGLAMQKIEVNALPRCFCTALLSPETSILFLHS
jgi:hypothetical protein